MHSMPARIKSKAIHKIGLRAKLSTFDYKSKNISSTGYNMDNAYSKTEDKTDDKSDSKSDSKTDGKTDDNNNKFSQIFKTISDIKYISKVHNNELEKHNTIIDYTSELVDRTEDKIFRNRLKIKKILD